MDRVSHCRSADAAGATAAGPQAGAAGPAPWPLRWLAAAVRTPAGQRLRAWLRWRAVSDWRAMVDYPRAGAEVGDGVLVHGWAVPPAAAGLAQVRLTLLLRDGAGRVLRWRSCRADQVWLPRTDVAAALGDARFAGAGFAIGLDLRGVPPGALVLELHLRHPGCRDGWSCSRPLQRAAVPVDGDPGRASLVGLFDRSLGLGAAVHGLGAILEAAGARVQRLRAGPDGRSEPMVAGAASTVVQLNPDLLAGWLDGAGASAWTPRRIAAVSWELPTVAPGWREALALWATEVWVPSRFVAQALAGTGSGDAGPALPPIRRVAHAVQAPAAAARPPHVRPRGLPLLADLPADRPLLLCMFDYASDIERKNPLAAIEVAARVAARAASLRPVLVLKTLGSARFSADAARIAAAVARARRHLEVRVIDADLPRADCWALLARCDVVLALHRAEGFGLVVAEAMALGKPVLVSDWSGSRDFAHAGNALPVPVRLVPVPRRRGLPAGPYLPQRGAVWGEPDLGRAAQLLQQVLAEPGAIAARAARAAVDIGRMLAPAAIAADALGGWCSGAQGAAAATSTVPNTLPGAPASTRT